MLAALGADGRNRTRFSGLEAQAQPIDHARVVGPAVLEPAACSFSGAALPSELKTQESGSRDSNPVCLVPDQAR